MIFTDILMKGKKYNSDFVSSFIEDCLIKNISSSEDILLIAEKEILEINNKIIEIEKLKQRRSKLLDVVDTFKKPTNNKTDRIYLKLFSIQNRKLSKIICNLVSENPLNIKQVANISDDVKEINFCIKQLIENKILKYEKDFIIKADFFDDYVSFIINNENIK